MTGKDELTAAASGYIPLARGRSELRGSRSTPFNARFSLGIAPWALGAAGVAIDAFQREIQLEDEGWSVGAQIKEASRHAPFSALG